MALPKAYLFSEDDLKLLGLKTGCCVADLLDSATPDGRKNVVAQALESIDAFLKRPLMFIGHQDRHTAITIYIEMSCRLNYAARGFSFISYCCFVENMGSQGPDKLIHEHPRFEDMMVALRELHQRYLAWMQQHLYYFSFELLVSENFTSGKYMKIIRAEAQFLGISVEKEYIAYCGPYMVGGEPPRKIQVYLMRQPAVTIPNICKVL